MEYAAMTGSGGQSTRAPHGLTAAEAASAFAGDPAQGLSASEAAARFATHGPNRLREKAAVSNWLILGRQRASPGVALLGGAMVLAAVLGEGRQALAVGVVLAINVAIGFVTEQRAMRSMEALRRMGERRARVRRDGGGIDIPAAGIVPGDIVLLEGGDVVPADLRLIQAAGVLVDESALTGESVPVAKGVEPVAADMPVPDRACMLHQGTALAGGSGEGIAVATGRLTELGRIARMTAEAEGERSPLERRLAKLSQQLVWVTVALAALIALAGWLTGRPPLLMAETAIALAIAAVPEGLPVVATLALARGMLRMGRRNALVERLSSVETLGATTLILTDKTGTLTENRMQVERIVTAAGAASVDHARGLLIRDGAPVDPAADPVLLRALLVGVLCSNADYDAGRGSGSGDPMEVALLRAGGFAGLHRPEQLGRHPELAEHAFDSRTRRMTTVHADGEERFAAVKGAPETVLPRAERVAGGGPLTGETRQSWLDRAEAMAAQGLRVLALAERRDLPSADAVHDGLVLLGLVGFRDPPRADVAASIAACRRAGIRVVMATGDHPSTALSIAASVGLADPGAQAVTGPALKPLASMTAAERAEVAGRPVFARMSPEQKLDLIALFQEQGHIVAMTGDGVNDAPALKKADIGVAMGLRGTQVAREAADVVLRDDAFPTIVEAVREGRVIFGNIRRFSAYLLSCNLAEVLVVGLAVAAGLPLPLLPLQILFLNIVTDVFPAFALAAGEGQGDVLARPPRRPGTPLLGSRNWRGIGLHAAAIALSTLGAMAAADRLLGLAPAAMTTVAFLTIALAQLWHIFNMRTRGSHPLDNDITRNRLVWGALALCLALLAGAALTPPVAAMLEIAPIGPAGWLTALGFSLLPLLAGEAFRLLARHR